MGVNPDGSGPRRVGKWPPHSLLGALSPDALHDLLRLGTVQQFGSGETVLLEGAREPRDVYVLLEGSVKVVSNTEDGTTVLLSIRADGDLIGELSVLDDSPRLATVITIGSCLVRRIDQTSFLNFLKKNPSASLAVNRTVTAKLRNATWHRIEYGSSPAPLRLARLLIQLATQVGDRVPDGIEIRPFTQPELAALIGAREPTVQKALSSLRHEKVIDTGYKRVIVRNWAALHSIAGITKIPPEYGVPIPSGPHSEGD